MNKISKSLTTIILTSGLYFGNPIKANYNQDIKEERIYSFENVKQLAQFEFDQSRQISQLSSRSLTYVNDLTSTHSKNSDEIIRWKYNPITTGLLIALVVVFGIRWYATRERK